VSGLVFLALTVRRDAELKWSDGRSFQKVLSAWQGDNRGKGDMEAVGGDQVAAVAQEMAPPSREEVRWERRVLVDRAGG